MGMYITEDGKKIIGNLKDVMRELKGISNLEERLQQVLKVENIIIVPGILIQ